MEVLLKILKKMNPRMVSHLLEMTRLGRTIFGSKAPEMRALRVKILSLSCSFGKTFANRLAHPLWELVPPSGKSAGWGSLLNPPLSLPLLLVTQDTELNHCQVDVNTYNMHNPRTNKQRRVHRTQRYPKTCAQVEWV